IQKTRPQYVIALACTAFRRKDLPCTETIQGEWGIWSPGGRPAGAASFFLWFIAAKRCRQMSALGQSRNSSWPKEMPALPPKADIHRARRDVRFVPKADHKNL